MSWDNHEELDVKITEVLDTAKDAITVRRVYAEPYERDGLTVIAAATISGGAGGGSGQDENGERGEGAGFGVGARPVGAYVIKDGRVTWRPAVDLNRVVTTAALVAIAYLLTRPRWARR